MRNAFLSIAIAAISAAPLALGAPPAAAQGAVVLDATPDPTVAQPVGLARARSHTTAHVIAPRTPDVPRNTLITSTKTYTLNADGTVRSREVASNDLRVKGKAKARRY